MTVTNWVTVAMSRAVELTAAFPVTMLADVAVKAGDETGVLDLDDGTVLVRET